MSQCKQCKGKLPEGRSKFCSRPCMLDSQVQQRSEARRIATAAKLAGRKCERCNQAIPQERTAQAKFCSVECKKKTHDERWRAKSPGYNRKYLYGLTEEVYAKMLADQGNACAICGTQDWGGKDKVPHVDHDHGTGVVRGLLCHDCNMGVGWFRDSPARLRSAARYLER